MKIKLDLDHKALNRLKTMEETNGMNVNEIIEYLVNRYLIEPEEILEDETFEDIDEFSQLMFEYIDEVDYAKNTKMAEAFKVLNQEITNDKRMLSLLYQAYKDK